MSVEQFLAEARRLASEATPGPWGVELGQTWWVASPDGYEVADTGPDGDGTACEDAIFIAHTRTALPRAVAALEAVLELHSDWTDRGDEHRQYCRSCGEAWPCATRRVVDEALNEGGD